MFNQIINIITSPVTAFQGLREKPTILFPLLLVIVLSVLAQLLIFNLIDFEYMKDSMIEIILQQPNSPAESEVRQGMSFLSPIVVSASAIAAIVLVLPLVNAIFAGYLLLIGKLSDDELSFKHFFSLTCWASMTSLLAVFAATLMVLLSSSKQFAQDELNPLSLGNLLFRGADDINTTLVALDLTTIWKVALIVIGFKVISQCSWTKAGIVVLSPYVIIYGALAFFSS